LKEDIQKHKSGQKFPVASVQKRCSHIVIVGDLHLEMLVQ